MSLTTREQAALTALTEGLTPLWGLLRGDPCHPSDVEEVVLHVHAIQSIVMARSAVRSHPDAYTHMRSFCEPVRPNEIRPTGIVCTRQHGTQVQEDTT